MEEDMKERSECDAKVEIPSEPHLTSLALMKGEGRQNYKKLVGFGKLPLYSLDRLPSIDATDC